MKKYLRVVMAVAMVLLLTVSAAALDLTDTGSLSMTLETSGGRIGSNLDIVVYQVAEGAVQNNNLVFVSLVGSDYNFQNLSADDVAALAAMDVSGLTSFTGKTDAEGKVTVENLPIGMYLVKLVNGGNFSMTSFVAPVPVGSSTDWDFTVEASPKVSYTPPYTPPNNPPTEEPPTEEIPDEDVPKDQPEEPEEDLEEIEDEDVPLTELPDTGMLQWPIAVLVAGGILLFTIGMVVDRRAKKN